MDNNQDQNLTKLAKGGSISAISNSFDVISRMFTGVFITRLFNSAATFGLFELAYRFVFFIRILAVPGTNEGIRRFMPIYRADKDRPAEKGLLLYSLRITTVLSVAVMGAVMIFAPAIARAFNKPGAAGFIRVLALAIPLFAFLMITTAALTGIHRVKYQAFTQRMVLPGFRAIALLLALLYITDQRVRNLAVIWSFPFAFVIATSIAVYFYIKNFPVLRNKKVKPEYHIKDFYKFSLPLAASQPIGYLMNYIGTFIIAFYLTKEDIGQYGIVTRLSPLMIVPLQSAILAFVPMISELHHLGKIDELRSHFKFISKWIFAFSLFIFITFILLSKPILTVFGQEYSNVLTQRTLVVVLLAQLFNASAGPVGMLISMTGRPRINMYNTFAMLILNTILCYIFVPRTGLLGGIIGAGIAQALAVIGINTLFLLQTRKYLKMHPFSLGYLKPILVAILSAAIAFGIIHLTGFNDYWENIELKELFTNDGLLLIGSIFLFAFILGIFFAAFTYLLGLDEEDKFVLRKMFSKIKQLGARQSKNE